MRSSSPVAISLALVLLLTSGGGAGGDSAAAGGADAGLEAREAQRLLIVSRIRAVAVAAADPGFTSSIRRVRRGDVPYSWRPGCPVGLRQLRLLSVTHWGFGGNARQGELVVRRGQADAVVRVMRRLFRAGYPIRRMELVDAYQGDDNASMRANNTSGFNCRVVAGTSRWSEHARGWAIDVNPVQNPYVTASGRVLPPRGRRFADRSIDHPAIIRSGDAVVRAFAARGWRWGGHWTSAKDYQHFSLTGR